MFINETTISHNFKQIVLYERVYENNKNKLKHRSIELSK
jgi:hypothetical protein